MNLDIILNKIKKFLPSSLFKMLQPVYHYLLSWLAAVWYRFPSEELIVIGVTGTTGKTTTVYFITEMLKAAGYKVGCTSTAILSDGVKFWLNDKKMTMGGRFFTQKILRSMVGNKCQYAIIETSSEGIKQYRHKFINYDVLLFTGLYPEHIEAHGSFEKYKQAKGKLFHHLHFCRTKYIDKERRVAKSPTALKKLELERKKKTIIINGDDEYASYFLHFWADKKIAFTANKTTSFGQGVEILSYCQLPTEKPKVFFQVGNTTIKVPILGAFNAVNAMAALCVGREENLSLEKIKEIFSGIKYIPGRLEIIDEKQNFTVIVDYAFEPRAVEKLYETVIALQPKKIIHVLGACGGGRDVARRPILGRLAGSKADIVIITNEDPYDDDPAIIIEQVFFGAQQAGKQLGVNLFKILDRKEAIKKAFSLAVEGDIVLITGKGSEQFICLAGGEKIPWDDRKVARELLKEKFSADIK